MSRCMVGRLAALVLLGASAWAQVSVSSGPPPMSAIGVRTVEATPAQRAGLLLAPTVQLGRIDDSIRDAPPPRAGLLRVAANRPISEEQFRHGTWQQLPDGTSVWRLALRSNQAVGVRLHFIDFNVGQGKVWIHETGSQARQLLGPFVGRGRNQDGDFWTEVVFADSVEIEYLPAPGVSPSGVPPFAVPEISHLWQLGGVKAPRVRGTGSGRSGTLSRNPVMSERFPREPVIAPEVEAASTSPSTNYSCFLDATCYSSPGDQNYHPEVQDAIRSTALVLFNDSSGSFQCSGVLINAPNGRPLLLTAGHCINTQQNARTLVAVFNAVDQSCVTDSTKFGAPSDTQIRNFPQSSGVRLLSVSDQSFIDESKEFEVDNDLDYALVLLNEFPNWSDLLLSGYTSYAPSKQQVTSLSAPDGLFMKVSFGNLIDSAWLNGYDVDQTQTGRIDGGSSGSGIFDGNGHLLGVLSTGTDPCQGAAKCDKTSCEWADTYIATYTAFSAIYPIIRDYLNESLDSPGTTLPSDPNVFSASPISKVNALGFGVTELTYNAPSSVTVAEIHVDAPDGPLFYRGGQKAKIATGPWVHEGTTFYLEDQSTNQSNNIQNTLATVTAHSSPVTFAATPPLILSTDATGFGIVTLNWDVPGARATEVHTNSPSGPLFSRSAQESGWAATGPWVGEGTTFVLCDVSKSACSPQTTIATLVLHTVNEGFATIDVGPAWMVANQNPIVVPRNRTNAVATLSWNAPGASVVEIHVGSATGPLFMVSGPTGSAQTGAWVTDGLEFFLVDVSNGRPGTTVGTATVFLVNQS